MNCPTCNTEVEPMYGVDGDEDEGIWYDIYWCPFCQKSLLDLEHPFTFDDDGEIVDIITPDQARAAAIAAGQLRLFEVED